MFQEKEIKGIWLINEVDLVFHEIETSVNNVPQLSERGITHY